MERAANAKDAVDTGADVTSEDALRHALALLERGEFWESHEALEPAWLAAVGVERHFLGGVILLAAALHKSVRMGSDRGGRRNFAKALAHLALVPDAYGGIDVREFEARVHRALREHHGRLAVPLADDHDGEREG